MNNMDKSDVSKYLQSGPQTEITTKIEKIAQSFKKEGIDLVFEILSWIYKNIKFNQENKMKLFRQRTADQIIKDGFATGCTDWALIFIVLARAKKIPTIYVETIRKRWLEEGEEDKIEGHIFAECFIDEKWHIINPEQATIHGWYEPYIIFKKGLDSWDIEIKNFDDLKNQFLEFKNEYKK